MLSHRACADSVLLVCVITVFSGSLCGQEMDAEEVVEMIGRNERLMRNIQCRFRWLEAETGLVYRDSEWGYESGKEFVAGTWHAKTEDGEILPYTGVNAFDGKVVRSYTYVPSSGDVRGGVYGYDPHVFSVGTSPKTLLGYTLDQDGIYTLSELLSDEYVLNKSARLEPLEGRECIVLEVTGFRVRAHAPMYDVRIWIDPKRNYRPLQIDKYDSADDKESLAGLRGERWKYLSRSVHGIELREVEGIWFPVCGEEAFYEIQPEFIAKGGTEEEFRKRHAGTSDEELAKTVNLVTVPMGTKHRVELREVRINRGIDPAKFSVVFPIGCKVWDDIAGIGYVVGEGDDFALDDIAEMNDAEVAQSGNPEGTEQSVRARNSAEEQAHAKRPALEQRAQTGVNRPTRLIGWLVVMGLIIVIVVVAIVLRARR